MPEQTFFLDELLHFCAAQTIPSHILTALLYYDFKETASMAFVHSIGGSHGGDLWERTGYCGLGRAVKTLGYHSGEGLEVDYVVCISWQFEGVPTEWNHLDLVTWRSKRRFSLQHLPRSAGPHWYQRAPTAQQDAQIRSAKERRHLLLLWQEVRSGTSRRNYR